MPHFLGRLALAAYTCRLTFDRILFIAAGYNHMILDHFLKFSQRRLLTIKLLALEYVKYPHRLINW